MGSSTRNRACPRSGACLALWVGLFFMTVGQWLAAAELNITRNQLPVTLGQYLDYLDDPGAVLTIRDILEGDFAWSRSRQSVPTLGLSTDRHWFHIQLSGRQAELRELALTLQAATIDRVDFYFVQEGEVLRHAVAGDTIAFVDLEHPYRVPVVPFLMPDNDRPLDIYLRISSSAAGVEVPLSLTSMNLLAIEQQSQLAFFGAFFAFFFFGFCICAVLYYNFRDRSFLGHTLFFGGAIPFFLTLTGMGRVWFWGNLETANNRIGYLSATLIIVSMCQLGQSLSLDYRYRNQVNRVLRVISWLTIPLALYFLLVPLDQITSSNVITLMAMGYLVAATVFVIAGVSASQGSRAAVYLFLSWALVILAYSLFLLYKFPVMERGANQVIISQSMIILAGVMLLLSVAEIIRGKSDELVQVRQETRDRGDFLRNVSREFLGPVHLILTNSKKLLAAHSSTLDSNTRQHMNSVIKQSDHLHRLINDLLEMAEIESESFEPEFELVEIAHFLAETKELMLPSAMEKDVQLRSDFASPNLLVQTDRSRLQHALLNIITNAIKYTDEGSITIACKAVYFRRRLGIEIIIRDTGRGMSEEFQQHVFREFSREERDPALEPEPEPRGTGLGLAIVRRMIEKLNGEISFSSEKGEGSQFFIRLPLRVHQS